MIQYNFYLINLEKIYNFFNYKNLKFISYNSIYAKKLGSTLVQNLF